MEITINGNDAEVYKCEVVEGKYIDVLCLNGKSVAAITTIDGQRVFDAGQWTVKRPVHEPIEDSVMAFVRRYTQPTNEHAGFPMLINP